MRVLTFICFFVSIILSSCGGIFYSPPKYNPEKAGAAIVESYNISNQINADFKHILTISDSVIYEDKIYIYVDEAINVFQKNDFKKVGEIEIAFLYKPDDGYKLDRNELIIVSEEKGFLLCEFKIADDDVYLLYSLNLKTGDTEFMDMNEVGIYAEETFTRMGYDKINDYIWFSSYDFDYGDVCFYKYDTLNNKFLFQKKTRHIDHSMHHKEGVFINGDEWFYTGYSFRTSSPINIIGTVKYNVNNPDEMIYFINAEYLEIESIPRDIIYDEPYIWMLVKKDNKLQMLKLLPNEEN